MDPSLSNRIESLKAKSRRSLTTLSSRIDSLRHNPAVIGGLATMAGFAVGLAGRYMRHRAHAPRVVVIEAF